MGLHDMVHTGLSKAPDPVTGTLVGTGTGAALGILGLFKGGATVAGFVGLAKAIGIGATVAAVGTTIAPVVGCCAAVGALSGLANYCRRRGQSSDP